MVVVVVVIAEVTPKSLEACFSEVLLFCTAGELRRCSDTVSVVLCCSVGYDRNGGLSESTFLMYNGTFGVERVTREELEAILLFNKLLLDTCCCCC